MSDDGALVEPLALDIQPALDALEPLGEKLSELATGFADQLSEALGSIGQESAPVVVTADTTELDTGIADALDAPRPPVDVDADTDTLTASITDAVVNAPVDPVIVDGDTDLLDSSIQDAVDQEIPPLTITGDTTELSDAIDAATQGGEATIQISADASELQSTIDGLTVDPIQVPVELDTGEADDQLNSLSDSASNAIGGSGKGVLGLASAVGGLAEISPLAEGETQGLVAKIAGLTPETAAAAGGVAALAGFIGEATNQAASAQAQTNRLSATFGGLEDQLQHINVGGLSISLKDLGTESATSSTKLDSSASRIGEMGKSAGAAGPQIVGTTQGILALSGAAAVTNPELGDTADVADRLSRLLQTGGPRLAQYGISLSSAAIRAEALKENVGKTAAELTPFDKLVAGTTLALAQQGDTLGTKFAAGAKNAQIELRSLKVTLEESLTAIGGPLLDPLVTSLKSLLPVGVEVGAVLGDVAQIVLPLLGSLAPLLIPVGAGLKLVGDGLQGVQKLLSPLDGTLGAVVVGLGLLGFAVAKVIPDLIELAFAGDLALGPVGWVVAGVTALGLLGGALDLFGHHSHQAAIDTTSLDTAFDAAKGSASQYANVLGNLNKSTEDYLNTALKVKVSGSTGFDTINKLGTSFSAVQSALTGTDAGFTAFLTNITNTQARINLSDGAFSHFQDTLLAGRKKLEDNAGETLAAAEASGLLTKKQIAAAQATNTLKGENDDYGHSIVDNVTVLRQLAPALAIAAQKQSEQSLANFRGSDSFTSFSKAVAAGAVSLADAQTVATEYNLTNAQAIQVITDLEAAQDKQAATTVQGTAAFRQLVDGIARGTVSIPDAEARLQALGFSIDGAKTAAANLAQGIQSAVSKIVSNLPQASTAASQWATDVGNAFQKAQQDAQSGTGNISADLKALADSKDPQRFFDNLVKQSEQIAGFEGNIKKLIKEGLGNIGGFLAQQPIDVAAPLAAAIASDPSKAKTRAAVFQLAQQISGPQAQKFFTDHAQQLGLATGTDLGNGIIVGGTPAVDHAAAVVASRFKPDFKGAVTPQIRAAATALQNDPTITQAAGEKGIKVAEGLGNVSGVGETVTIALRAAHDAVSTDTSVPGAAAESGAKTGAAFKPDLAKGTTDGVTAASNTLLGAAISLGLAASEVGVAIGQNFDAGFAAGITDNSSVVVTSATTLGTTAEQALKDSIKVKSPSQVARAIGQQFSAGLGIGITDGGSLVAAAGTQVADDLVAQLKAALAAAGTGTGGTTNQAVDQLFSSASGALGSVGASISKFSSDLTNAQQKRVQAATAEHKVDVTLGRDQVDQAKLLKETGIAYGVLSVAQEQYNALAGTTDSAVKASTANRDAAKKQLTEATNALSGFKTVQQETSTEATTALQTLNAAKTKYDSLSSSSTRSSSGVSKQALTDAKNALHDAQSTFDHFNNQLDSATKKTASALQRVQDAARGLKQAQHQLDVASDPGTFTRNLNAQTAAGNKFAKDLAKLNREGFTDLAKQLAAEGPEVAGALAAGFAKSSAKAKAAESAIDHANQFATSYQAELEKLFGQGSAAVTAAGLVGSATGAALVQGLKVTVGQGVGQVAGQVAQQLGAVKLTPKLDLTPAARIPLGAPQKAIPPVAFGTPVQLLPLGGTAVAQGSQTITMDLTINLEDGRTVHAQAEVPLPQAPSLASRVVAEVNAS